MVFVLQHVSLVGMGLSRLASAGEETFFFDDSVYWKKTQEKLSFSPGLSKKQRNTHIIYHHNLEQIDN